MCYTNKLAFRCLAFPCLSFQEHIMGHFNSNPLRGAVKLLPVIAQAWTEEEDDEDDDEEDERGRSQGRVSL